MLYLNVFLPQYPKDLPESSEKIENYFFSSFPISLEQKTKILDMHLSYQGEPLVMA